MTVKEFPTYLLTQIIRLAKLLDLMIFGFLYILIYDMFSVAVRDKDLLFSDKVGVWLLDVRELVTIPTIILFVLWVIGRWAYLFQLKRELEDCQRQLFVYECEAEERAEKN